MGMGLEAWCRERGMAVGGQRRVIVQVLAEFGDTAGAAAGPHRFDVEAVHRRAVLRDPRITLAAVCRTLQWLEDVQALDAELVAPTSAGSGPTPRG